MAEWRKLGIILGKGSYGIVYLAVLVSPIEVYGKLVAVKSSTSNMLNPSLQREGSILKLFHGCKEVIQCIPSQVITNNGQLVYKLLMEFAPFCSLGDLIRSRPLMESEVRVYTRMLLRGLYCIHQHGVVHCDLKPDNILLFPLSNDDARYQLKIADFGLSKTREDKIDGKIKFRGTPLYMSPESVVGKVEAPLDIWSLGCIVIEMITGLPAQNGSLKELMFKLAILKEAPSIPDVLNHDCKDFLNKCFEKNPNHRWTATMLLYHPFVNVPSNDACKDDPNSPTFKSFFSYDPSYVKV
jgi:serine/threonine protein kinase